MLSIKVDIDTVTGLKRVPVLLDLFNAYDISVSFFVPMGPDNTGRHISRIVKKDFLIRCLKVNPLSSYDFENLLYGLVLPPPKIGENHADVLKAIIDQGHELGLHGYNHYEWQVNLKNMQPEAIRKSFDDSSRAYKEIVGADPRSSAAPGWQVSFESLKIQDEYNFLYASDTRGRSPFYPYVNLTMFKTLQIPTTMPTLDELSVQGLHANRIVQYLKGKIEAEKISVMTCHTEHEGHRLYDVFRTLIRELRKDGIRIVKMDELVEELHKNDCIPTSTIVERGVSGLEGYFSFQGKNICRLH